MGTVHGTQPHIWGPFYTRKPGSSIYVNSNPDQLTTHRSSPEKTESYMIYTCCCPMSCTTETWKTNLIRSQIINNFWRKRTIQAQKLDLNIRLQKLLSTDLFPGQPCALAVFLHVLCIMTRPSTGLWTRTGCWGEETLEGSILPGWWGIMLLSKDPKLKDFIICSGCFLGCTPAIFMVRNHDLLHWDFLVHKLSKRKTSGIPWGSSS